MRRSEQGSLEGTPAAAMVVARLPLWVDREPVVAEPAEDGIGSQVPALPSEFLLHSSPLRASSFARAGKRAGPTADALYFAAASTGTASTADSNAMNNTQGAVPQDPVCGALAGP